MSDNIELLPLPHGEIFSAEQMTQYAFKNILHDREPRWKHVSWEPPTVVELEEHRDYVRNLAAGDIKPCVHCGKQMDFEDGDDVPYPLNRYHDSYILECTNCGGCMYGKSPKSCVEKWNSRANS